jgi:hypothetical protein
MASTRQSAKHANITSRTYEELTDFRDCWGQVFRCVCVCVCVCVFVCVCGCVCCHKRVCKSIVEDARDTGNIDKLRVAQCLKGH